MKSKNYARLLIGAIFLSLMLLQTGCCMTTPSPESPSPPVVADSDHDGVLDNLDICPDTAAGMGVDSHGCRVPELPVEPVVPAPVEPVVSAPVAPIPVAPVVVLPEPVLTFSLEYLPNEAVVGAKFVAEMEKVADFVKANPGRRFVIEGHTDSIGNDAANMKLSLQRAEKIRSCLIEKSVIPAALVEARGFGESSPVADNDTQEGRSQNRRVDIIALPQ